MRPLSSAATLGYAFLALTCGIWVFSSFLVQWILGSQGVQPALLTYVANTVFIVFLPIFRLSLMLQAFAARRGSPTTGYQNLLGAGPVDGIESGPPTWSRRSSAADCSSHGELGRARSDVGLAALPRRAPEPSARGSGGEGVGVQGGTDVGGSTPKGDASDGGSEPADPPGALPVAGQGRPRTSLGQNLALTPLSRQFQQDYMESVRKWSGRRGESGTPGASGSGVGLEGPDLLLEGGRGPSGGAGSPSSCSSASRSLPVRVRHRLPARLRPPEPPEDAGWTGRFSLTRHARAALIVCPLWFVAQLSYNASLGLTSVTSNTILSSTSCIFTFALSAALGRERFTVPKFLCVLVVMAGTALVTLSDQLNAAASGAAEDGRHTVQGDALVVLSALCYAAYTLALDATLHSDREASMPLFFGLMGAFTGMLAWPAAIVASLAACGSLRGFTPRAFGICAVKGLISNVMSDYFWARAVLLVGPTVATVGLSIQVPMATAVEFSLGHLHMASAGTAFMYIAGAGAVLGGFVGAALLSPTKSDEHAQAGHWPDSQELQRQDLYGMS